MKGAFYTGQYRNVFAELGHSQEEIAQKLKDAFHTVFYGPDDEKFYFEAGDDMGYFEDTGNFDARTEGMSYAMMMCVQMDMKNEFDRVWKWARTYMYMEDGYNKGYFAWSCKTTGEKNDLDRRRMEKNFLQWHCSLPPTAGATAKEFSITHRKQETF